MATTKTKSYGRKTRDKRYREKHKEEIALRKKEWEQANRVTLNERKKARRHKAIEKAIEDLTEHYFYSWVSQVGADRLFDNNAIWANKDAIYGWLCNEANWDEEDKKNFAKIRKKNIPRLAEGVYMLVLKQIEANDANLPIDIKEATKSVLNEQVSPIDLKKTTESVQKIQDSAVGFKEMSNTVQNKSDLGRYDAARQAIDNAVEKSSNMDEFKAELKSKGYMYQFDPNRKYWTVTVPGWEQPIRTYRLGDEYSKDRLLDRIYSTTRTASVTDDDYVLSIVKDSGFEYIDKRSSKGALWIIAGEEEARWFVEKCKEKGILWRFAQHGSRSTKHRPGWYHQ